MTINIKRYSKMKPLNYIKQIVCENLWDKNADIFLFWSRARKDNKNK